MKNEQYDRVRRNTAGSVNLDLDSEMMERIEDYESMGADAIEERIDELDQEWDMERILEANASVLAFSGLVLSLTHSRKWLILPGIVLPFLFQHAVQGWCPPVPVFRRLDVRTRNEIDREKYILKALRGDFERSGISASPQMARAAVDL